MKRNELYRCEICKMQIEVTVPPEVEAYIPFCCDREMKRQEMNSSDGAGEKHLPTVESINDGILVKVGSVPHPMTAEHHIEWIEVINGSYVNRCYLKPGDEPQAAFYVPLSPKLIIRESCNIHGVWQKS